jgi:hypothetical protein
MPAPSTDPIVNATAILHNRVDLRGYPYRYLTVRSLDYRDTVQGVREVMAAAEVLGPHGWDLVTVTELNRGVRNDVVIAVLTRRVP